MASAGKILRKAIHAFLQNYHSFVSIAALVVLPVSASVLLSQGLVSSPLFRIVQLRFHAVFDAAGFPDMFFSFLNAKLSETIFTFAFTLPFTFTLLVIAKAAIIQIVFRSPPRGQGGPPLPLSSIMSLYSPLFKTHVSNALTILSINAAVFSLFFFLFNAVDVLRSPNAVLVLSAAAAILYSVVLAHALVTCNLAAIVSGVEDRSGFIAILRASTLIKGRVTTALSLALPINLGLAAVEALFQYRVMRPCYRYQYGDSSRLDPSVIGEGFSIVYMHSILVVLDVVATCMFYKSCKSSGLPRWEAGGNDQTELLEQPEDSRFFAISKC